MCGLLKHGFDDFTRIGSFKRITKKLLPHTVHHQMLSEEASKGNDAMQELQAMALDSAACASDLAAVKQAMESVRNGKMAERAAMLKQRPVVGITCASATPALLADQVFSIVIMDEASQLTEPASLQPIVQAGCRFLLAVGDPKQLPPVVSATEGTGIGTLSCPLFTRLAENYITPILLRRQYRCHPAISGLASRLFYEGRLLDGLSIEERSPVFEGLPTLCMIEADGTEQRVGSSYFNDGEARAIGKLCRVLVDNGMDQADIGVISLYTAQASKIAEMLAAGSAARVKSSTVDAFQGEEREVILLSTVRSHSNQHTSNRERMCVALTRAKRHLVVFGAGSKMASNGLWKIIVQSSRTVEHVNLLCSSVASSPCQLQKPMDDHILEEEPTSSNVILMHDELPTSIQMDDDDLWDDDDDE